MYMYMYMYKYHHSDIITFSLSSSSRFSCFDPFDVREGFLPRSVIEGVTLMVRGAEPGRGLGFGCTTGGFLD